MAYPPGVKEYDEDEGDDGDRDYQREIDNLIILFSLYIAKPTVSRLPEKVRDRVRVRMEELIMVYKGNP
jgi:hypothetical protein